MSRPLREATTYLVLAFSLAIGIATALPHAGINVLLSAFAPSRRWSSSRSPSPPAAGAAPCGGSSG